MVKIDIIPSESPNNNKCEDKYKYDNGVNYDWVLNELNKDFDSEGMARIGFTEEGYEVFIVTDDYRLSDSPHFHYRKKEKDKKMSFHTCIQFDQAKYYHHTKNEDILNDSQKENLINFLNSKPNYFNNLNTYWDLLKFSWNHQNDYKMIIDEDLEMPDYRNLK